jgi:hypothetical protein
MRRVLLLVLLLVGVNVSTSDAVIGVAPPIIDPFQMPFNIVIIGYTGAGNISTAIIYDGKQWKACGDCGVITQRPKGEKGVLRWTKGAGMTVLYAFVNYQNLQGVSYFPLPWKPANPISVTRLLPHVGKMTMNGVYVVAVRAGQPTCDETTSNCVPH